jgi:succinoglycan biosynthesis protein ExoM
MTDLRDQRIIVGICTCRNPDGLAKLLNALRKPECTSLVGLVVVENDAGGAGAKLAAEMAPSLSVPVHIAVEPQAGIPFARNRVFTEALKHEFDYLVFIDDDEFPSSGWLNELLRVARESDREVVFGPVHPIFKAPVDEPIRETDFHKRGGWSSRKGEVAHSTANLMLSRKIIESSDEWFDVQMAFSGGTDTDYLWRLHRAGFDHAFAENAFVWEDIPPSRARPNWLLSRARRNGSSLTLIRAKFARPGARNFEWLRAGSVLAWTSALSRLPLSERTKFVIKMRQSRAQGRIEALRGNIFQEYAQKNYRA